MFHVAMCSQILNCERLRKNIQSRRKVHARPQKRRAYTVILRLRAAFAPILSKCGCGYRCGSHHFTRYWLVFN